MDAAVRDQPLDRLPCDFAAEWIEAGEDDGARRVVHDQLDAGGDLERADVASFAADDAPLQVVAREIDDRHRRFDRVLGRTALDGVGDDLLRALSGGFARLGLEPLDQVGGVAPRIRFDLPEQELARFVRGEPRDPLQLALAIRNQLLGAREVGLCGQRLRGQRLLAAREVPVRAGRCW